MVLSGAAFSLIWFVDQRFLERHSWGGSIVGAAFAALIWTILMAALDRYRRSRGRRPFFADGSYRANLRTYWAAARYSPLGWLGFAGMYAAFVLLGLVIAFTNSVVLGLACAVFFGALMTVCVVQALRSSH